MVESFSNESQTTLNGAINDTTTSITVTSAADFPSSGNYRIRIEDEFMLVTAGQGTTSWTVTREAEDSARFPKAAHGSGATVTQILTAGGLGQALNDSSGYPPSWSPDVLTHDYEFESSLSGWTDLGSPTKDANSTAASHLYLERAASSGGAINWDGIYRAIPSTPFTITIKLTDIGHHTENSKVALGLIVGEATPGNFVALSYYADARRYTVCERWTNRTTYNTQHGTIRHVVGPPLYLRIVVNSTSSYDSAVSGNGLAWVPLVSAQNPGFTIGSYGIAVDSYDAPSIPTKAFIDWLDLS